MSKTPRVSKVAKRIVAEHLRKAKKRSDWHFEALQSLSDLEFYAGLNGMKEDCEFFTRAWHKVFDSKVPKD